MTADAESNITDKGNKMNKNNTFSTVVYVAAALFNLAAIIMFASGMEGSTPTVFLCLGSSFLCLGSVFLSRARRDEGDNAQDKSDKNGTPAEENSESAEDNSES